ncbi:PF20097 family protein [Terrisporobacter sp.]
MGKCPYCNNEMVLEVIHGGRDTVKWIPKEKDRVVILSSFVKGIKFLEWCDSKLEGYYCKECEKITIDVPKQL